MAQFRSSAREGSFADNQLAIPSTIDKIQSEANRQLSGMDRAQKFQARNQEIALQAQKQTQGLQEDFREAQRKVGDANYQRQYDHAERAYKQELIKKENEDKYALDTFGALADWSKTALDLYTGITEQNKELQQKTIKELASHYQLSHKDIVAAKSVDSSITAQQWQESEAVQKLLKEGKSQDYVNVMYQHLVKGGGYKNYIHNSIVLHNTGKTHGRFIYSQAEKWKAEGVPADEILKRVSAITAQQRGGLSLDGKRTSSIIEAKGYNQEIDKYTDKVHTLVNIKRRDELEIEAGASRTNAVIDRFNTGGVSEALAILETQATTEGVHEVVGILLKQKNLTIDDLDDFIENPINVNGNMTFLSQFPATHDLVLAAKKSKINQINEQIALEKQVEQAKVDIAGAKLYEELNVDGVYTETEHQQRIAMMDAMYPDRDRSHDALYKKQTITNLMRATINERLEEYKKTDVLSEALMDEMQIPAELEGRYRSDAQRLDRMRATPEYKGIRSHLRKRLLGVIGQSDKLVLIDGDKQSDQVEWYVGTNINKAVKAYQAAVLAGVENPLEVIGNQFADKLGEELKRPGFVQDYMITSYPKAMRATNDKALISQRMVTQLAGKTATEKSDPNTWVELVGTKNLKAASKQLAEKGTSEVLRVLGSYSHPPLSVWEVHEKISEVNKDIDPVEMPSYMELYKQLPAQVRNTLNDNRSTYEQKYEAAKKALRQFGAVTEEPPVRSTFQQDSAIISITPAEGGLKGLTQQDYSELAYAASGEAFRGDMSDVYGVVASILNRKAQGYGGSNDIYNIIRQPNQYAAVVTDKTARYEPDLAAHLASPEGQRGIRGALEILQGRTSFKGTSQHHNMGPTDPGFHPRGNRYHYEGQTVGGGAYTGPIDRSYEQFYE